MSTDTNMATTHSSFQHPAAIQQALVQSPRAVSFLSCASQNFTRHGHLARLRAWGRPEGGLPVSPWKRGGGGLGVLSSPGECQPISHTLADDYISSLPFHLTVSKSTATSKCAVTMLNFSTPSEPCSSHDSSTATAVKSSLPKLLMARTALH